MSEALTKAIAARYDAELAIREALLCDYPVGATVSFRRNGTTFRKQVTGHNQFDTALWAGNFKISPLEITSAARRDRQLAEAAQ